MKKDILAKMTADTRTLIEQMQAQSGFSSTHTDLIQLARQGYRDIIPLAGAVEEIEIVENYQVSSAIPPIDLRLYRPQKNSKISLPALVYLHGGGFISGGFDTHDRPLRTLANLTGCAIIAVDYRLAPESPFPAAPEDCFAAWQWVTQNADELRIDSARVAVGGDSAGGLLAAVLCLMCRDRNVSIPLAQILIYPNTDLLVDTPSWYELDFLHPSQSRENFLGQVAMYVPDVDCRKQPYASPLRATDFAGLSPAFIITAELDPQKDEGEAYAQKLRDGGCLVTHTFYPGVIHGFFQMGGVIASGRVAIAEVAAYLKLRFQEKI